ncbi:MAG: hypothetical protein ABIH21_01755 [Patescibacteria group bacterium]
MKIAIFLHGTIIMHKNAARKVKQEIIQQVKDEEESVRDYFSYTPVGNAPEKLQEWAKQGAEIYYLSALTTSKRARGDEVVTEEMLKADKTVLDRYGFPEGEIYHRKDSEEYKEVINRIEPLPNILIEDDCESIGADEMVYPSLQPELQTKIKSISVPEFGGIDHLPDKLENL